MLEAASCTGDVVEGGTREGSVLFRLYLAPMLTLSLSGVGASAACVCFGVPDGCGALVDGSRLALLDPGSSPSTSKECSVFEQENLHLPHPNMTKDSTRICC